MTTLRTIIRVIIFAILPVLVVAWVCMMALNTTIFNSQAVKAWAASSGVYDDFTRQVIDPEKELQDQVHIDVPTLEKTIDQTFPPSYIQQHGEKIVDAFYAWLNGTTAQPTFTVPTDQKGKEFAGHLKTLLEPQFASYPRCPITIVAASEFWNTKCLPPSYTAQSYATTVANEVVEETSVFRQPFTGQDVALPSEARDFPQIVSMFKASLLVLSVGIAVLSGLYLLLSVQRLKGVGRLGCMLFVCGLITLIAGGVLWAFGNSMIVLPQNALDPVMQGIAEPVVAAGVPSVGMWVSIYGSITLILGIILWVVGHFVGRGKREVVSPTPVAPTTPPVAAPPRVSGQGEVDKK